MTSSSCRCRRRIAKSNRLSWKPPRLSRNRSAAKRNLTRNPRRNEPEGQGRGAMKLVVGLGNPGSKYERSRHNVGFDVVDQVANTNGGEPFKSGFDGVVSECVVDGERMLLLKPMTYMN